MLLPYNVSVVLSTNMAVSIYPAVIEISKYTLHGHKKTDSGTPILLDPEASINPVEMNSELGQSSNDVIRSQTIQDGRTNIILYGVGGIVLVVVANLIILGNNVLIKEYGIDYVDMILLRSSVQLLILGAVIKFQGNNRFNILLKIQTPFILKFLLTFIEM